MTSTLTVTAHGVPLPAADQPGPCTSAHSRGYLRYLCVQPAAGLFHLCCDRDGHRTYCTAYHSDGVAPVTRPRLTSGDILRGLDHHPNGYRAGYQGVELAPCPDCLTMACVESELLGDNRYPVVSLTDQLRRLPDDQDATTDADYPQA